MAMFGPSLLLAALSAHCLLSITKQRRAALVDAQEGERGGGDEREAEEEGIERRSASPLF